MNEYIKMGLAMLNIAKEEVEFAANIQEELWQGSHDEQVQKIGIHLDSLKNCLGRMQMVLDRTYDCAENEKVHMALENEKVHMALKILNRAKEEVEFAANIQEELWQGSHDEQVQKIGILLDSIRSRLVGAQKSLNSIDEK